ncbi:MAG: DUF4349 domain-containing protein [Gemmatimonadota bacterium]|nr:DUF4349 domain-containing protein [Gemmatimonadota bacterium]
MKTWVMAASAALLVVVGCSKAAKDESQAGMNDRPSDGGAAASPAVAYRTRSQAVDKMAAREPAATGVVNSAQAQAPSSTQFDTRAIADSIVPSMIIRTGQAAVYVDSLQQGIERIRALAKRVGGYVANTSIASGNDQTHTATLEVKLPASRFDEAISGLNPIGKVESVNVQTEDVGEEFVDVTARAANLHKLEARLIDLLATRTGKLADIVEVEDKLSQVRGEIERMEGRMRYLKTRSAISTLTINVHEKLPVVSPRGSGNVIVEAFADAWRSFVRFVAAIIASLGVLVPLALITLGVLVVVRRYVKLPPPRKLPPKTDDKPPTDIAA